MPKAKSTRGAKTRTPVEQLRHDEAKRRNIPTNELQPFMGSASNAPKSMLYPRDPSLDPQLVWKGKDREDAQDLEVPVLPIYIQEKIQPKALIEDLRAQTKQEVEAQASLFGDFNGIEFDDLVEFYQHDQSWTNRMILGDSLAVMTSLAEKEGLKNQVQCIYVDPPYGIKFGSNWQTSTRKRDVRDGKPEDATRQPEQVKAFRDTWEFGVHSYLSYLRERLEVARDLLSPSGSIFVQIGDENVHLVRALLDEVFGSENFVSLITYKTTSGAGSFAGGTNVLSAVSNYLIWYASDLALIKYRPLFRDKDLTGAGGSAYNRVELPSGDRRPATAAELSSGVAAGRFFRAGPLTSQTTRVGQTTVFPVEFEDRQFVPGKGGWKTNRTGMAKLAAAGRLISVGNTLSFLRYLDDFPAFPYTNLWDDTTTAGFGDPKLYAVQTNAKVIQRCLLMASDPGDLVLDPTCGSGTTAVVAEQWGRRWITIDTSRVALALARQRLTGAKLPYYVLADPANEHISAGFRCKKVPHVTLKAIANNPDISEGMTRGDIRTAIARHADQEVLYDQPEVDTKVVRVTGPFTVESLSPHVTVAAPGTESGANGNAVSDPQRYHDTIVAHLRKAGVQNAVKQERLGFDSLEPWPGAYVHASGEYRENGSTKRAAISIGPEYGTVDAAWVREAAKEAAGVFDLVIVCGFAFDGYLDNELKKLGAMTVLKAAMNPDMAMGDDLLKKTGAGNLFMVFGEPDIEVRREGETWVAEIHGLDVYDPTTGEIRSRSTDDIACWFIDTSYNAESFFVRHAYFTGANDPYQALKRALRADIDEEAWASLYSTVSRPFPAPATGKIAVKVINHYGDEVMKVYEVGAHTSPS